MGQTHHQATLPATKVSIQNGCIPHTPMIDRCERYRRRNWGEITQESSSFGRAVDRLDDSHWIPHGCGEACGEWWAGGIRVEPRSRRTYVNTIQISGGFINRPLDTPVETSVANIPTLNTTRKRRPNTAFERLLCHCRWRYCCSQVLLVFAYLQRLQGSSLRSQPYNSCTRTSSQDCIHPV